MINNNEHEQLYYFNAQFKTEEITMNILSKSAFAAVFSFGLINQSVAAECIAPANPGGGWDFTCRSITKIMSDIGAYDGNIQVTNM
ncbi:MAG: hypothetical protein VXA09_05625, partial [Burkholderiaceae bacterium]